MLLYLIHCPAAQVGLAFLVLFASKVYQLNKMIYFFYYVRIYFNRKSKDRIVFC